MDTIPTQVLVAMDHVRQYHPHVTMVLFNNEGRWRYMEDDFTTPVFVHAIDTSALEDACNATYGETGKAFFYHIDQDPRTPISQQREEFSTTPVIRCGTLLCGNLAVWRKPWFVHGQVTDRWYRKCQRCFDAALEQPAGWYRVLQSEDPNTNDQ